MISTSAWKSLRKKRSGFSTVTHSADYGFSFRKSRKTKHNISSTPHRSPDLDFDRVVGGAKEAFDA